jgi:adenylate kinase family enzyme
MFDLTYFHPIFDTFPVLETERLVLREMDLSDIEDVYQIYAEPEVTRFRPVLDEICDKCGGQLYTREDDKLETVESRLSVYKNQTFPLIDYYKEKGILVTVNGEQHVDKVFDDIISALERFE